MSRRAQLAAALEQSDIRVLLMVLVHLTGDLRWLERPYQPVRDVRLIADPDAGLAPEVRAEIRAAALDLLDTEELEPAITVPDDELFLRMMSVCLGESVPSEYVPMMLQEMGFRPDSVPSLVQRADTTLTATVIGAGIAGIAMATRLRQAGVRVTVLEKNDDIGGTWLENTYPDCGVDTPNHFYSYSFAPNPDWNHYFSLRDEIFGYLQRCVDDHQLRGVIEFGITVERLEWDAGACEWQIECTTSRGDRRVRRSALVFSAVGQLNRPSIPDIAGLESFPGSVFHSAAWHHDVDLSDRRVGVVGAGASAMQFVPRIAPATRSLTIFQRSPQWARPIGEYRAEVSHGVKWLIRNVPFYAAWMRFTLAWRYGDGLHRHLRRDPAWPHPERSLNAANERHRVELETFIADELEGDHELIAKVVPPFPPYAKRMLIDNGWYRTLRRPNVTLETAPIERVEGSDVVVAGGGRHEVDVLILATGFLATDILGHIEIRGRDGVRLSDQWGADDARAYLGMTMPGFPNLFVLYGPNTNLGHGGSIIFHVECQVRYVLDLLDQMMRAGARAIEVRADVHDDYNDAVDAAHAEMVWTHPGVSPWYRNAAGRVVSNSPWRLVEYWHLTHHARLDDYLLTAPLQVGGTDG